MKSMYYYFKEKSIVVDSGNYIKSKIAEKF